MDSARAIFEGGADFQGGKVDDHLKRLIRMKHKPTLDRLKKAKWQSKPPAELRYLLAWYNEIRGRNPRGMHVEPVPISEMLAYSTAYQILIEPWEIDVLCRLDGVWLECVPKPEKPG
jgi:hypothetical protein